MIAGAEAGELVTVRHALEAGARINARDQRGRSPLLAATQRNEIEVARLLIREGADVNAKDFVQDSPLLSAASDGRIEILKMILATGPDLKDINRERNTALNLAAQHDRIDAVKLLLATKIDRDHVNNLGWTPLLQTVIAGEAGSAQIEVVRLLIAGGADVNIADRDGVTALAHAKRAGFSEIIRMLGEAGGH